MAVAFQLPSPVRIRSTTKSVNSTTSRILNGRRNRNKSSIRTPRTRNANQILQTVRGRKSGTEDLRQHSRRSGTAEDFVSPSSSSPSRTNPRCSRTFVRGRPSFGGSAHKRRGFRAVGKRRRVRFRPNPQETILGALMAVAFQLPRLGQDHTKSNTNLEWASQRSKTSIRTPRMTNGHWTQIGNGGMDEFKTQRHG